MVKPSFNLSVYLVTDAQLCGQRGVVETVLAAARGGATIIQLRDPDADTRALVAQARGLVEALRPFNIPLIVNDRVDVVLAAGARGVHLGQDDMAPADARALLGPDAIIGLSVGSLRELGRSDLGPVDYVGIGPVSGTATKANAGSPIGVEGFATVRREIALPAVAIGGIDVAQTSRIIKAGADGVAVVSAICAAEDAQAATAAFAQAVVVGRGLSMEAVC